MTEDAVLDPPAPMEAPGAAEFGDTVKSTRQDGEDPSDSQWNEVKEVELAARAEAQLTQLTQDRAQNSQMEEMLLKIEQEFKAEQIARKVAEERLAEIDFELRQTEEEMRAIRHEFSGWAPQVEKNKALHNVLEREQDALELVKAQVLKDLERAKGDATAKTMALQKAEEAIRREEATKRMKIESEHVAKVSRMGAEIERLRDMLHAHTQELAVEIVRWKSQAEAAAQAVEAAKREVMARKRELDNTNEELNNLVEELYGCREKNQEIRGSIQAHQERYRANMRHHSRNAIKIDISDLKLGLSSAELTEARLKYDYSKKNLGTSKGATSAASALNRARGSMNRVPTEQEMYLAKFDIDGDGFLSKEEKMIGFAQNKKDRAWNPKLGRHEREMAMEASAVRARHEAATRIQAVQRGRMARKKVGQMRRYDKNVVGGSMPKAGKYQYQPYRR